MMEEFEIELPEPQKDGSEKDNEKGSFKSEYIFDSAGDYSSLLHAAPSAL
jgi:hypothetical protein